MDKKFLLIPLACIPIGYLVCQQYILPLFGSQIGTFLAGIQTVVGNAWTWAQKTFVENPLALIIPAITAGTAVFGIANTLYKKAKEKQAMELTAQALTDKLNIQQTAAETQKTLIQQNTAQLATQETAFNAKLAEYANFQKTLDGWQTKYDALQLQYEKVCSERDNANYLLSQFKPQPTLKP